MGCGGSRLGGVAAVRAGEGGVVPLPVGISRLLRRRLEEMKKRSHASVLKGSQTQSKKELLKHGFSENEEETDEKDDNSKSSAKVAPTPVHQMEEKKEVIDEKISSRNDVKVVQKEKDHHGVDDDDKADNVKKEGDDGIKHVDHDETIKEDGDHDEGMMDNLDERMICFGSPSFRVYCIDVTSNENDDEEEEEEKDGEDTRKSMEAESTNIDTKEDESIIQKKKRERKGKRFGIALPRKYLTNVTVPCYAGGGCMGNSTHSRLMQDKSNQ